MSRLTTKREVLCGLAAIASTSAMAQVSNFQPRPFSRGARVPAGLINRIKTQNAVARSFNARLVADQTLVEALGNAHPSLATPTSSIPAKFQAAFTPVKNQGACGSCWAFAAVGAYEAAYLKTNSQQINVSEQEALDCTFADNNCIVGGWHEVVFLYLQLQGLIDGNTYPYHEAKQNCTSNMSRQYYALNWGYIRDPGQSDQTMIPSDMLIKQSIMKYGPVASGVLTASPDATYKSWDAYQKRLYDGQPNPDWSKDFPKAVFTGVPSKNLKANQIDHEVVIVGWDDNLGSQGCWTIKNSWGTNWGDEGLIRVPYGTCNIGFAASWVTVPSLNASTEALAAKLMTLKEQEFHSLGRFYLPFNQLK